MHIKISKNKIFKAVASVVSYIGAKANGADASTYDQLRITDYDSELVNSLLARAITGLNTALAWCIEHIGITAGHCTLWLRRDTVKYNAALSLLSHHAANYLTNSIIAAWLRLTHNADAEHYASLADADLKAITSLTMYPRKRR